MRPFFEYFLSFFTIYKAKSLVRLSYPHLYGLSVQIVISLLTEQSSVRFYLSYLYGLSVQNREVHYLQGKKPCSFYFFISMVYPY